MIPFGLTNNFVSFQSYIHGMVMLYLHITIIIYLDDVLIFSRNSSQNKKHVRQVLKAFLKGGLYSKLSKYLFNITRIFFLGFILTDEGVEMEKDCISTIFNWPEPESVSEVQRFLEFANFYHRFIKRFSRIAYPLTDMTQRVA